MGRLFETDICAYDANSHDTVEIEDLDEWFIEAGVPEDSELAQYRSMMDVHDVPPYQLNHRVDNGGDKWGASLGESFDGEAETNEVCRKFSWTPTPYQGGLSSHICFFAKDSAGDKRIAQTAYHCIHLTVQKCVWAVNHEDSLVEIAARYNTNWLQLWHLNPTITHPDRPSSPDTLLNVGHLYTVEFSDTMEQIAERFGTSLQAIVDLNANIGDNNDIYEGEVLCILPNSCHTSTDFECYDGFVPGEGSCHKRW
jgi:hypothetical protein